ncbi:hypothetical protein C1X21_16345 [Pseudomonas sp. FW305-3-2-15-A-LB2]|nr:hypothetical protein C1X17_08180 [Pseudomonas sp. FW305-3-2-15-C-TSA2]PMV28643.1 hypothetical protein C1X22_13385 [Pseudomonas sp. DP16D-L5]PMV38068.1 hypothetical protein C1X21_16345 [Pseudomonas sp. FW305-3-2-15-A-LB2]PMV48846.1 hypothetical protein C1X16_03430 [Pseudomonas sp. FW305-3-2-15-C-R2A1]PMV53538.1 hypothetical protein C1X18_06515 [Pseudomonas sp. FW305-3-2-15-C-LB1]PMV57318.1 hypothetical protein C1X19_09660 [Pseudomonas sp. GW460-4]PMV64820.1 hypothetical protein C1X20_06745 
MRGQGCSLTRSLGGHVGSDGECDGMNDWREGGAGTGGPRTVSGRRGPSGVQQRVAGLPG